MRLCVKLGKALNDKHAGNKCPRSRFLASQIIHYVYDENREARISIDLVKDEVENTLEREVENIKTYQQWRRDFTRIY